MSQMIQSQSHAIQKYDENDLFITSRLRIEESDGFIEDGFIEVGTEDQIPTLPVIIDCEKSIRPRIEEKSDKIKKTISKPKKTQAQPPNYPGETKNIPKNFSRALKAYIKMNYSPDVFDVPEVRILMRAKNDKAGRDTLTNFMKGTIGRQIAKDYFGNQNWAFQFILENKVSVDQFFKFNEEWYLKTL